MTADTAGVAIVTGSSGGIGREICRAFLNRGYRTVGLDIEESTPGTDLGHYFSRAVDLSDPQRVQHALDGIALAPHNVLVNCAGIREICNLEDLTLDLWQRVMTVNVTAPFLLSKEFFRRLTMDGKTGNIVNIASVSGLLGEPKRTAYVSSKHALIGLTKQLAIEFGRAGIRVNAVSPGIVRTPLTEAYYSDAETMRKIKSGQFLSMDGHPADVASAVMFLAESSSRFITGATLCVDGGWTIGKQL
ncbi:SDR family NAD(P)-dependent oxidoreductase [Methylobacterium sp. JK268]